MVEPYAAGIIRQLGAKGSAVRISDYSPARSSHLLS